MAAKSAIEIRPYVASDREEVREISRRTAFRGLGYQAMLEDPELFADYWSAYYTDHEPESLLVAERDGRVVGYLFGCRDARKFMRVMTQRIVPSVAARLVGRAARGRYRAMPRRRALYRWLLLSSWREAPPLDVRRYPAHYHVNLLRDAQGRMLYSTMALQFMETMLAEGCSRMHGQLTEPADGVWHRLLSTYDAEHPGFFEYYAKRPTRMAREVLGVDEDQVNHVYGLRIPDYLKYLQWLAHRYRI